MQYIVQQFSAIFCPLHSTADDHCLGLVLFSFMLVLNNRTGCDLGWSNRRVYIDTRGLWRSGDAQQRRNKKVKNGGLVRTSMHAGRGRTLCAAPRAQFPAGFFFYIFHLFLRNYCCIAICNHQLQQRGTKRGTSWPGIKIGTMCKTSLKKNSIIQY